MIPRLPNDFNYCTTPIVCTTRAGGVSQGTGFFYAFCQTGASHIPALVTNKHVIDGSETGKIFMHGKSSDGGPAPRSHKLVEIDDFSNRWIMHPDPKVDLCILPLASLGSLYMNAGELPFHVNVGTNIAVTEDSVAELTLVEDIIMVGYPIGLWDTVNNLPILRRGSTATHPASDYLGSQELLIDIACFPGSSGSPVFVYSPLGYIDGKRGQIMLGKERLFFLGTLYAGYNMTLDGTIVSEEAPTGRIQKPQVQFPINLGRVIKASKLLEFEHILNRQNSTQRKKVFDQG